MQTQSLNGYWQFRSSETQDWLPAQVPGGVHTDLMAVGRLPDPFVGVNEKQVQWVAEKDWVYRKFFYPLPALLAEDRVYLVCDGLDTLADVRFNGQILGTTDNMFRTWEWDVKRLLREGENRLEIHFHSPAAYARLRERNKPMQAVPMGLKGGQHLRKSPSHFGWDWGPRLPCMGIWRGIHLEGRSTGRLLDVRFDQDHEDGMVNLFTRVQCDLWDRSGPPPFGETHPDSARTIRLRVTGPDREVWQADAPARPQQSIPVTITNPQLWWPNGYGEQPLYRVEVDLIDEERAVDRRVYTLGLRTLELRQAEDEWGKSFTFVVNGLPLWIKGSNWIPADSFPTRVSAAHLEHLIRSAAETNQNMLRVWGGGTYESDNFYDLCDQYGILVWQDFPFACGMYPLDDPAFLASVRCEVVDNVRRLRHHSSLALWCGNNEIEWQMVSLGWRSLQPALTQAYEQFFYQQLPELLAGEDPRRPYWPSSPSSNDPFNQPNQQNTGDAHLWEVYHHYRKPRYYRQQNPRFASEFGFQSLPDPSTIEKFATEETRRLDSDVMRLHQRSPGGSSKLIWYLNQRFPIPRSFDSLVYLSQVYQAEAVRSAVEHWRRHPERTSGALYWQLNDCWPVISWSSIDYFGRWKLLHYAARRFFAPVAMSILDNVDGRQHKMAVWLANDTGLDYQGELRWTLETLDGEVLKGGNQPVTREARTSERIIELDFSPPGQLSPKVNWRNAVFVAELWQGDMRQDIQVATFVPEKQMPLENPDLQASVTSTEESLSILVHVNRLARFITLELEGANVLFSDNGFDLPAGREVTIKCPLPQGWTEEQAQAAVRVRSLADLGPCEPALIASWKSRTALVQSAGEVFWKWLQ